MRKKKGKESRTIRGQRRTIEKTTWINLRLQQFTKESAWYCNREPLPKLDPNLPLGGAKAKEEDKKSRRSCHECIFLFSLCCCRPRKHTFPPLWDVMPVCVQAKKARCPVSVPPHEQKDRQSNSHFMSFAEQRKEPSQHFHLYAASDGLETSTIPFTRNKYKKRKGKKKKKKQFVFPPESYKWT